MPSASEMARLDEEREENREEQRKRQTPQQVRKEAEAQNGERF